MSDKKQLNEEQLEKVNGGGRCASPDHLPATHGAHIYAKDLLNHKELFIGKKFYCVSDADDRNYCVVTLVDVTKSLLSIWEKFTVEEVHGDFNVNLQHVGVGVTYEFKSAFITMYAYEVGYEMQL